jgi:hypothetical protein
MTYIFGQYDKIDVWKFIVVVSIDMNSSGNKDGGENG